MTEDSRAELRALQDEAGWRLCPFHGVEHRAGRTAQQCGERARRLEEIDPVGLAMFYRKALAKVEARSQAWREKQRAHVAAYSGPPVCPKCGHDPKTCGEA